MVETTVAQGPLIDGRTILFRYPDPGHSLRGVRLYQEIRRPRNGPDLGPVEGGWEVAFPLGDGDRIEYQFELVHHDGGTELVLDPDNPLSAPGAFGDKSVVEMPGYRPPVWVGRHAEHGTLKDVELRCRPVSGKLPASIWSPPGTRDDEELPLLVVHDGPEYARYSSLTGMLEVLLAEGAIPRLRAALVAPVDRDQIYSASAAYTRSLAHEILPAILELAPTPHGRTMRMGMGASLGALAMLHVHRKAAATFGSLFLQSGSYFRQRFDSQESGFVRFRRISRFVGEVLTARSTMNTIPITMTCGTVEENLANNRAVEAALRHQGYEVKLVENRDAHNWVGWRDTFDPHLVDLINRMWG
ncbi:MAG TPA: alpha/beta hydrolase-fold protein [Actinomycetota bacterium]|nr:alpha/beta hydrolase-fold protein [Actinomycetota bacterium]